MKPFDYSLVLEMLENDSDAADNLLKLFIEQTNADMVLLREAYELGKLEQVSKTAHKLKSSFAVIGLEYASSLFKSIEHNSKNSIDLSSLEDSINEAHACMKSVHLEIAERLS